MTDQPAACPAPPPRRAVVRRLARALALTPAVLATLASTAAVAAPPEAWEDAPSVSPLAALLILAVIPAGLFLLITLLVYVPSMSRTASYHPGEAWRSEPQWFGGPRGGVAALEPGPEPQDAGDQETVRPRGGASGRW